MDKDDEGGAGTSGASGSGAQKGSKSRDPENQTPLWLGDELEFWPLKSGSKETVRFSKIAVLHSELVAVSTNGHLYQVGSLKAILLALQSRSSGG